MFEKRDSRIDLLALTLGAVAVFLALSLLSHNAADPPVELASPFNNFYEMKAVIYPVSKQTLNACGRWGALASAMLLDAFGYAAYFVVGSVAALAVILVLRRDIDSLFLRAVGWTASLVGITALMSMLLPWSPAGSLLGAGGHLGALVGGLLESHFASAGGFVLAASLLVGGMLLSTDYLLLRLALIAGSLMIAITANRRRRTWRQKRKRVDEVEVIGGETLAMRLRGKNAKTVDKTHGLDAEVQAEDCEDEEDQDAEYEVEEDQDEGDEFEEDENEGEEDEDEDEDEDSEVKPGPVISVRKPIQIKRPEIAKPMASAPAVATKESVAALTPTGIATASGGVSRRRRLAALRIHRDEQEVDRDAVMDTLDEASEREDQIDYDLPDINLLAQADEFSYESQEREVLKKAKLIDKTFKSFGFDVRVVDIEMGPVIAQYELELQEGLRLNKITALADDLAIALRVPSVRIVAPIPGKNTVGIEVPNSERQLVRLREAMEKANGKVKKMGIPLFLGKDVSGNPLTVDLAKLPHLLIAGRTGTGKSVCLNAIISSILMTRRPDEVRMLMIDPKMVELSGYGSLPHLMHPVVTDMRKAEAILAWAVEKMEERYALLARAGVRHMSNYNSLSKEEILRRLDPQNQEERDAIPLSMPYIVIVADEMADLMMTAGKEVQTHIIRLAQKSRAVGIHLILATQKPTVDVITGLIKSNLPARIAFQVASRTDSRVVLDEMGADKLLGNGDMLFLSPGTSTLIRGQGTYLSDEEIDAIVECCSTGEQNFVKELVNLKVDDGSVGDTGGVNDRDDLYDQAVEVVIREGRGSISLLQRALGIGYGRAARLVDFMAEDGIVGPYAGSKTRQVVVTMDDWSRMKNAGREAAESPARELGSVSPIAARGLSPRKALEPDKGGDINDFVDDLIDAAEADGFSKSSPRNATTLKLNTAPNRAATLSGELDEIRGGGDAEEEDESHDDDDNDEFDEDDEFDDEDGNEDGDEDEDEDDVVAVTNIDEFENEANDVVAIDDGQVTEDEEDDDEDEREDEEDDDETAEEDEDAYDQAVLDAEQHGKIAGLGADRERHDDDPSASEIAEGDDDYEYEYVEIDVDEDGDANASEPENDEYEYIYEDVEDEYEYEEEEYVDEDLESEPI